ncbi:MAG: hypothetical protein U0892_18315 [Pirellulales bacterium]
MAQPTVLFLSKDIFFAPVVKQAVESAGARYLAAGSVAASIDRVADAPVAAAIVDLTPHTVESIRLISDELNDSYPDAVRIAFGPHVNTELFAAAEQAGFAHVLAKGAVAAVLPKLLAQLALDDHE